MAVLLGVEGAGILAAAVLSVVMVTNAFRNRIVEEETLLPELPQAFEGFRILFITDIHRRVLPAALLKPLKGKVDAVFVGGDMTEKGSPLHRLADNMNLLVSIGPTYVIHGNHDYRANIGLVDNIIRGSGARLLRDETTAIRRGDDILWLTGVDFPARGGKKAYAPLPELPDTSASSAGRCRIILVHDPLWLSQRSCVPAELVLAGHTHGGQVVLPFLGRRHVEAFYHTYSAGWFTWPKGEGSQEFARVLISRGFGTAHFPIRFRSPAEMHVLTLRRGKTVPKR